MQIHELPTGTIGSTEYSPIDNGTSNRKITLASIGTYILGTLTMTLGGVSRTVKAAIDAHQTSIDTVNSKLTSKTKTVTGTTAANGSLYLQLNNSENIVVSVKDSQSSGAYRILPVSAGAGWYAIVTTDGASPTAVTNTSVSLIVRYLEI